MYELILPCALILEEELQLHIEHLAGQLLDPASSVFNLHVPPIQTPIDTAPVVDENLSLWILQ